MVFRLKTIVGATLPKIEREIERQKGTMPRDREHLVL